MDDHGGGAAPPRPPKPAGVHRSRPRGQAVSLLRPRPDAEREPNAYVEAPRRVAHPPPPHKPTAVTTQPGADKRRGLPADSIVCGACGRCRCGQCARGRPLPQRWLCGACLCSAEACVDYASCMCCVKALFYHCGGAEGADAEAAEPCGRGSTARALCAGALCIPLPCLLLYWPLRGAAAAANAIYRRCSREGCRCREPSII